MIKTAKYQGVNEHIITLWNSTHQQPLKHGVHEGVHQITAQKQRSVHIQCPDAPPKVSMGRPDILYIYYSNYYCSNYYKNYKNTLTFHVFNYFSFFSNSFVKVELIA